MAGRNQSFDAAMDFRQKINSSLQFAIEPPSSADPCISRGFVTRRNLGSILTLDPLQNLLANHGDLEPVQQGYSITFSILVLIGKHVYIPYFIKLDKLDDGHLPFEDDSSWPPECKEFFPQFFEEQWKFCAQTLRKGRLNDTHLHQKAILPFTKANILVAGVTSCTYVVDIDPEYDQLSDEVDHDGPKLTKTYVLKTCQEKDSASHRKEVDTYKTLMPHKDVWCNIARFYGSWIQNGTYNMLLEYVDGGTLTEFYEKTDPPSKEEDIIMYWENLLKLVQPLSQIHEHQGIHQDIKGANILFSKPPQKGSKFDVTFKLADFGLTNFAVNTKEDKAEGHDAHGTQMYSAPEYCRDDTFLEKSKLSANSSKDIWSLGCVFSEAVVWSVLDKKGLEKYLELRRAETEILPCLKDTAYSGCFHDGTKVLDAVIEMHDRVRKRCRRSDYITCDIITIIEEMLEEAKLRPDARTLYRRFRKTIDNAKKWSKKEQDKVAKGCYPEAFCTSPTSGIFRATPPELPMEEDYTSGLKLRIGQTIKSSPDSFRAKDPAQSPSQFPSLTFEKEAPKDHKPIYSTRYSSPRRKNINREYPTASESWSPPPRSPTHPAFQLGSPRWSIPQNIPEENETMAAAEEYPSSGCCTGAKNLLSPRHTKSEIPNPASSKSVLNRNVSGVRNTEETETKQKCYPEASVKEVLQWIVKKKENPQEPDLSGHPYLGRLHGRDQVFLVDNSISMKRHWSKVKDTLNALGYLVKHSDLDGMDLYFTNSPEEGHGKTRKNLIKAFNKVKVGGQCNMKAALGRILEEYSPEKINVQEKSRFSQKKKKRRRRQKWGLSVYVLTDGVWEDDHDELCGVHEPIAILVNKLIKNEVLQHHVGIQFIQFGNSEIGTRRLSRLDNDLFRLGVKHDIVDSERFNGNVWKMLLGHFDPFFDGDSPRPSRTLKSPLDIE